MRARLLVIPLLMAAIGFAVSAASQEKQVSEGKVPVISLRHPLKEARLEVQRVQLRKPLEIVEEGVKRRVSTVLEFRVSAAEPIPVRALDPVLVVGGVHVREYHYENRDRALVFTLFDPAKAKEGAEIHLQFGNDAATRTEFPPFRTAGVKSVRR